MNSMIFSSNALDHFAFGGQEIRQGGYAWSVTFPPGTRVVAETATLPDGSTLHPRQAVAAVCGTNGPRITNSRALDTSGDPSDREGRS